MTVTTRAQLTLDATGYMHRADLPYNTFIDRANERIGRDFRVQENVIAVALPTPYDLPVDYVEVIRVQFLGPRGLYPLVPLSSNMESVLNNVQGTYPIGYWIRGNRLLLQPLPTTVVQFEYFARLDLTALTSATNALMNAYQEAYLWLVLMQASLYIQQGDLAQTYKALYDEEWHNANEAYNQRLQPIAMKVPDVFPATTAV
jgi:hypothetical protein